MHHGRKQRHRECGAAGPPWPRRRRSHPGAPRVHGVAPRSLNAQPLDSQVSGMFAPSSPNRRPVRFDRHCTSNSLWPRAKQGRNRNLEANKMETPGRSPCASRSPRAQLTNRPMRRSHCRHRRHAAHRGGERLLRAAEAERTVSATSDRWVLLTALRSWPQ